MIAADVMVRLFAPTPGLKGPQTQALTQEVDLLDVDLTQRSPTQGLACRHEDRGWPARNAGPSSRTSYPSRLKHHFCPPIFCIPKPPGLRHPT